MIFSKSITVDNKFLTNQFVLKFEYVSRGKIGFGRGESRRPTNKYAAGAHLGDPHIIVGKL